MRQALHIFKKDVRGLAYEIVVTLVLVAAFPIEFAFPGSIDAQHVRWSGTLAFLLPLIWWLLAARVIHAEAIPGDRQFWLTRPYSWKCLLSAKLAFLVLFVCVPMIFSDVIILHEQGFPVMSNAAGMLWLMVLRFEAFVLFGALLASLTRRLSSFVIAALLVQVVMAFNALYRNSRGPVSASEYDWALAVIGMALVPVAILFQYARRMRIAMTLAISSWALLIAGAVWFPLPAFAPQKAIGNGTLQFELDVQPKRIFFPRSSYKLDEVPVVLPIKISGIPEGLEMREYGIFVRLESTSGERWDPTQQGRAALTPDRSFPDPRFFWVEIKVPKGFYDRAIHLKKQVRIHIWTEYTLYRHLHSTLIGEGEFVVPGVGYCQSFWRSNALTCRSALRHPTSIAAYDSAGFSVTRIDFPNSPFPAEFGISPIVTFPININSKDVELVTGEPVAYLQQAFDLAPVRLQDYVELRPSNYSKTSFVVVPAMVMSLI